MKEIFPLLLGNKAIKDLIGKDIVLNHFSHAYIIEGAKGSGKHLAAKQIAAAVLCDNRDKTDTTLLPCGSCLSCKKIKDGYNTCITYVNRGELASISVEVVRNILSTINYLPEDGNYKFYIIEEAEKMTPAAQNALLLSLEEPPSHVVFLLLTSDSDALLETIRSRTHILKTEAFTPSFISSALNSMTEIKASKEQIDAAALSANGSIGAAIEFILGKKNNQNSICREKARQITEMLICANKLDTISFFRELKMTREEAEPSLTYSMCAVRDLISQKAGSDKLIFYTETDDIFKKSGKLSVAKLYDLYERLLCAKDDICIKNASINTVLTTLAAGIVAI